MKPRFHPLLVLILVFVLSFNISCDIFTPLDPDLKVEKEAWDVIIEAHALKQLWFHHFFRINSNNYQRGQLFVYEPTEAQVNFLLDEFEHLMSYSDAVIAAVDSLENLSSDALGKSAVSSSIFGALKSFFGAGKEVSVNNRKRLLLIASNMNQADRDQLYEELVIDKWKNQIGTSGEFWTKLQNGDLDDKASTLYKNFYDGSNALLNPFTGLANDKNLTPGQMLAKDGINLCNKGFDVVLETGKIVVPGLSQATDLLDAGKDFVDKAEKMVDKPLDFIADEVKSRASQKVVGMTGVGELFNADGVGTYVKILAETTLGSDDPQELVEDAINKGINYGVAKITSTNGSVNTDIAIAKNQQPGPGLPEFIIGVGTYAQKTNEFLLKLPTGNWGITSRANTGQTSTSTTTTVITQQAITVDVAADTSSTPGDSTGTPSDTTVIKDPETLLLEAVMDSLNMKPYITQRISLRLMDYSDEYSINGGRWDYEISNNAYYGFTPGFFAPQWTNYSFVCDYSQDTVRSNDFGGHQFLRKSSTAFNGAIFLDTTQTPMLSLAISQDFSYYYGITEDVIRHERSVLITIDSLPLTDVHPYSEYIYFASNWDPMNGLPRQNASKFASLQTDYYDYDSTGTLTNENHNYMFKDHVNSWLKVSFLELDPGTTVFTDY
jgi:hypothetical protein